MQDRTLDDDLGWLKPALQQRANRKTRRHLGKARQRRAIGQRHADILGPQIELVRVAVDPETYP